MSDERKQVVVFHRDGTNTPVSRPIVNLEVRESDVILRERMEHDARRCHIFKHNDVAELLVRQWED